MGAFPLNARLGVDTENGITIAPSLSTSYDINKKKKTLGSLNIGTQYNSRQGLSELTFSKSFSKKGAGDSKLSILKSPLIPSINASLVNFNTPSYITSTDFNARSFSFSLDLIFGGELPFTNL